MGLRSDSVQVAGIRCERCVLRLGAALEGLEGLEAASATLTGEVAFTWDDERVDRDEIVARMAQAGFRPTE